MDRVVMVMDLMHVYKFYCQKNVATFGAENSLSLHDVTEENKP